MPTPRPTRAQTRDPTRPEDTPAVDPPDAVVAGDPGVYRARVVDTSLYVPVRGLRYHLRVWETGSEGLGPRPLLLCLHGWMDVSASFQFFVDALAGRWRVVAPDWRGFGLTGVEPGRQSVADDYPFADYLGDLDALVEHLSPDQPVRLVAHSMGGNVATLFAGIRPARVAGLVNLEGFGMPASDPSKAVGRYRTWLDELRRPIGFQPYPDLDAVARRLMGNNPRLPLAKARFLARHWSRPEGGAFVLQADPAHRRINPVPYRVDEVLSCWREITAPVLWVAASDRSTFHRFTLTEEYRQRLTTIGRLLEVDVADAGHMVHHDRPDRIAGLVEEFFSS